MTQNLLIRVHGDNIVECERIVEFALPALEGKLVERKIIGPSVVTYKFITAEGEISFQLFPGFNKTNRNRWKIDILQSLFKAGSYLAETPDAIVTRLDESGNETVLCAIEFCSALQAGNQAWQRSGRAYSVARAGVPFLYIVDFIKYELNNQRQRKALRMPNAAIPYSYVTHSKNIETLCVEAFIRSEEFNEKDSKLSRFDTECFAEEEISKYLVALFKGQNVDSLEKSLREKNLRMVEFFAGNSKNNQKIKRKFIDKDWMEINKTGISVAQKSIEEGIPFTKKISTKSGTSRTGKFVDIAKKYASGISCGDLPVAVVPKNQLAGFINETGKLFDLDFDPLIDCSRDLYLCLVKGFKPRGDDNRPDRGILPLLAMLVGENQQIFTYLYGPMTTERFKELKEDADSVAQKSGFWNVFLTLSDILLIDTPIINSSGTECTGIIDRTTAKPRLLGNQSQPGVVKSPVVPILSQSQHEDDVDTVIHYVFSSLPDSDCFEGLCNPPGGDWSGLSVRIDGVENRWLSLPRVSSSIAGKRPDHVLQLFPADTGEFLLSIESKDRARDLELEVGNQLKAYIRYLLDFVPSALCSKDGSWSLATERATLSEASIISACAYIDQGDNLEEVFNRSVCDIVISMSYDDLKCRWNVRFYNRSCPDIYFASLTSMLNTRTQKLGVNLEFYNQSKSVE